MLVELKQRLREISDLNAAGDVLDWDQATYMPEGGAGARGRQRAILYRLAHEQAVAPVLGTLLDAHAETETRLAQTVTRHADEDGRLTDATDLLQFSPAERSKPDECCST